MELDGYLTGVVVSPDLLLPRDWLDGIWGENDPAFDDLDQAQTIIAAVTDHCNAVVAALGFEQIEAGRSADYRPLFMVAGGKPDHEVVRTWVRGFAKAMALAPDCWSSIAEDERLPRLLTPFIGCMDVGDPDFEPADDVDELLDEAVTAIPRAAIVLRKIARFGSGRSPRRRSKVGRNDPCPCGSGLEYKRCCGTGRAAPDRPRAVRRRSR